MNAIASTLGSIAMRCSSKDAAKRKSRYRDYSAAVTALVGTFAPAP